MYKQKLTFFLVTLLFAFSKIFGQIEITHNITIDDGLAYSQVTCAYKDGRGIIWFGTTAGLSEWNTVNFTNYSKTDGLPSSFISSLAEDNNNLYVGTKKGLVVKLGNRFAKPIDLPIELETSINQLYHSKQYGLFILTEQNGAWIKRDNQFRKLEFNSNSKIIPMSIVEKKSGEILVGTQKNGIYLFDGENLDQFIYQKVYSKYPVVDIIEGNKDSLFIALQGLGVVINTKKGEHKGNTFITTKHGLPSNFINDLELNASGELFVATSDGVAIVIEGKVQKIVSNKEGLENEFVLKTFSVDENLYYFLTEGSGVFIYSPKTFSTYNNSSGLPNSNVWVIGELSNGSFCFLTDNGLSFWDNNTFSNLTSKDGLGDDLLVSLFEDENGDLYLGTYTDGVNLISNGNIKRLNQKIGMMNNSVWSIQKLDNGNFLFVTHNQGIAVYDGSRIIDTLGVKNGLPNSKISTSFKRNNGSILVGIENGGVYEYKNNTFIPFCNSLSECLIWDMYEDENDDLYFGSNEEGLLKLSSSGVLDTISIREGLSNNTVISIESDDFGNIYAATDRGLNIIRFLDNGSYQIRNIYKQNGLANSECNQGAISKDSEGNIWVGTIEGVTKINPKEIFNSSELNDVYISKLEVMGKNVDIKTDNIFEYDQNDITFSFAGINYKYPGNNNYRYKLSNIDKNWVENDRNEIRYANLPSGEYKFSVAVANDWGIWSEPATVSFVITIPFWKTWWFIVLASLFLVGIISSVIYWRFMNLLKFERLRSSISADLHDEIGSGLSEVSILSELLKINSKNEDELQKGLQHIGDTTRSLIERLSDIIWIVNPRKETFKNLILRIQDTYQEVFYHADISFEIINNELMDTCVLPIEIKQSLYLIIKESINNSLKYSNCTRIELEVNKKANKLCVEIRDNGIGFEETSSHNGNGLFNMKKRAEKIQADLLIESTVESGTKIRIEVYLNKFTKVRK